MLKTFFKGLLASSFALALTVHAQDYPNRPIRIVVPFVAGGATDILARLLGERMGQSMRQPFVVENKAGAGGTVATSEVAKAPADGYTLLMATSSTHGINPAVYKSLKYDALKDFAPISTVALSEYALVVPASSPYRSVAELLQGNAKKQLSFASNGNGTTSHLASALFAIRTGTEFIHVPYKASSPAMTDLMGGQVDFLIDNTSTALQNATSGRLRILATTGRERAAASKDVPTMRESGVKDFEVTGWWALMAPAGTPPSIVERLYKEVQKAVADPEAQKRMSSMGNDPMIKSPAETRAFIETEMKKFKTIATAIQLQLD